MSVRVEHIGDATLYCGDCREVLSGLSGVDVCITSPLPSIRAIQLAVCERYGVTLLDLLSDRRSQTCTRPRMVAMWLAKRLTLNSIPKIGAAFRRDHSTVLHAIKRIDAKRGEPETAGHLAALLLNLGDSGERGDMRQRPRLRVVA